MSKIRRKIVKPSLLLYQRLPYPLYVAHFLSKQNLHWVSFLYYIFYVFFASMFAYVKRISVNSTGMLILASAVGVLKS